MNITRLNDRQTSVLMAGAMGLAWLMLGAVSWREWHQAQRNQTLLQAARYDDLRVVSVALDNGANINARLGSSFLQVLWPHSAGGVGQADAAGRERASTALLLAANRRNATAITLFLLRHGADARARNAGGETALHRAAKNCDVAAVVALLDCHADINAQDAEGNTPLMEAAAQEGSDVVERLIKRGANPRLRNHRGEDALDRARQSDNIQGVLALQQAQGDK